MLFSIEIAQFSLTHSRLISKKMSCDLVHEVRRMCSNRQNLNKFSGNEVFFHLAVYNTRDISIVDRSGWKTRMSALR